MGAAGIPIYPGGGRLCLSTCPGDGRVKKNYRPPPEHNFWNNPYYACTFVYPYIPKTPTVNSTNFSKTFHDLGHFHILSQIKTERRSRQLKMLLFNKRTFKHLQEHWHYHWCCHNPGSGRRYCLIKGLLSTFKNTDIITGVVAIQDLEEATV